MTIPNILTIIRLILTPFFIVSFILGLQVWSILIFSVAGFTDLIDGTIARLLKQYSVKGAFLDPMADKFLLESCFICLFASGIIPWWFFILAFGRDLMIVCGIFYLEYHKAPLPYKATIASKIATIFQLAVAIMGLIVWWQPNITVGYTPLASIFFGMLIVTTCLVVVSGAQYVFIGLHILREKHIVGEGALRS